MMPAVDWMNPDYLSVLKTRQERLFKIRESDKLLRAAKLHYENSPVEFIEDWMFTYDPRKTVVRMPFLLWPKQREYIIWLKEHVEQKKDGLVEKSRDAGATYLNMAFSIWLWTHRGAVKVGFGSRKEQLVDRIGDPDSIFEKGRIILRFLPIEMLPRGYDEARHATYLRIINPENESAITGEAGDNIGRGGRSTLYFKDESAFYERPLKIEASLSQNSDVKIDVSTPNGIGNPFYRKRMGGKVDVFIFDWRDDPRKDDAWYQHQKDTLDSVILAQEVDRDYAASTEGICIPANYVKAAINFKIPAEGKRFASLDVADEGGDENCYMERKGVVVDKIEAWTTGNTTQTARKAKFLCDESGAEVLKYDSIGVGAGVKGEFSSLSPFFQVLGVNVGVSPTPGEYVPGKKNEDMFFNLRAQCCWTLRRRFERTYEHVNGIKTWSVDDLISIPNDPQLVAELSQVKYKFSESGKIQIESKDAMRARGIKSPNRFDSLMLLFAPVDPDFTGIMAPGESEASKGDW